MRIMIFKNIVFSSMVMLFLSFNLSLHAEILLCDFEDIHIGSIKSEDAQISFHDEGSNRSLDITFGTDELLPKIEIKDSEIGDKIWNLMDYVYVTAEVQNLDNENPIEVFGYFNDVRRGNGMVIVPPQSKATLKIPICRKNDTLYLNEEVNEHLQQDFLGLPGGYFIGFTPMPDSIHSVNIHAVKLSKAHSIRIDNIKAETRYTTNLLDINTMNDFIDEFGQYKYMPEIHKTKSIEQMVDVINTENEEFDSFPGPAEWNEFGGWENGPQLKGTGEFRVDNINGKWWFIDPKGRLFWSSGINAVGEGMETMVKYGEKDYSFYFQQLPDSIRNRKFGDTLVTMADFYMSNLRNKYNYSGSTNWKLDATENIKKRLRSWGINTLGAWSYDGFCDIARIPYTVHINSGYKPIEPADVKDEDAWAKIIEALNNSYRANSETFTDSFCVGYFIDNEMYFVKFNDKEYEKTVINRYYTICDSIHDEWNKLKGTNKLNLGSRVHFYNQFYDPATTEQIYAMAKKCDVISINRYSYTMRDMPSLKDLSEDLNKPMIIGEFHFGALDRGFPFPGLRYAQDQDQRAELYKLYVKECLEHDNIVGAHWFLYVDRAFTACKGGENGQLGFVDVCDKPYKELVDAARDINYQIYDIRYDGYNCSDYESWDSQQWLSYYIGYICERNGMLYKCIDVGQSHRDPAGDYGFYGWEEIGECLN